VECEGCGKCCFKVVPWLDILLTEKDVTRVPMGLFEPRYGGDVKDEFGIWMKRREDCSCVALDLATRRCTIYDLRPQECRKFNQDHPLCKKLLSDV